MPGTLQQSCCLPPIPAGILAGPSRDALSRGPVLRGDLCKSTPCFLHTGDKNKTTLSHGFVMIRSNFWRRRGPGRALWGSGALRAGLGRCIVALRDASSVNLDGEIKSAALPFPGHGEIGIYRVADTGAGQ